MDKNKIIEAAAKLVAKGAYDKAIKEYQRILDTDPRDVRVLQKMGELYQKKNSNGEAAQYFIKVAESYANDGFFLKSVALFKQVLKLNPELVQVNLKLAELHQQLQLISEAMTYYQVVAAHFDKKGETRKSLDVVKKMVELDPDNVTSRLKLAELYAREKLNKEADTEFRKAADYFKNHNRIDDYLRVGERLVSLNTIAPPMLKEMATLYLERDDFKHALAKLQVCFRIEPKDIETLELLGQAFDGLEQSGKALSVYKELAKAYGDAGRTAEAKETWSKVEGIDPDDAEVLARKPKTVPSVMTLAPRPSVSPVKLDPEQIAKLLTETDVYMKYGLRDKALEHLQKIFLADPENLSAHEKAYQIYLESDATLAFEQLLNILRLCARRSDAERARPYLKALKAQSPYHPELTALSTALDSEEFAPITDDVILVDSDQDDVEVPEAPEDALAHVTEEDIANASFRVEEEELDVVEMSDVDIETHPLPTPQPLALSREPRHALEFGDAPIGEAASEECEEAEFFLSQRLLEEASELIETILIAYPGHPRGQGLKSLLQTAIEQAGIENSRAEAEAEFDIAAEVEEQLVEMSSDDTPAPPDDFQYSVEEVFSEFKKGIEKVVKLEDVETHYDLGIAYKEMGLLDDAIGEFKVARQGSVGKKKEIDCLTMIGILNVTKGEHLTAIDAFKVAAHSPHVTAETLKALHYEIGLAWEAMGESGKALHHFLEVADKDAHFRDVSSLVSRLTSSTKPQSDDLTPSH